MVQLILFFHSILILMNQLQPFHLAIPVDNLALCRNFYRHILNCPEGRSDTKWVDFDFFGHQLVIHERSSDEAATKKIYNPVDGEQVPVPHFGVVLSWQSWQNLKSQLTDKKVHFIIEPTIRFKGKPGEQATMFFLDPEGNALEFKAFKDLGQLFKK